jgi:hypothetical protein
MMPIFNHTPYSKKQIVELVVASHTTNIVPRTNYRFVEPQNGSTPHEHAIQSPYIVLGMVLHMFTHLSIM